MELQFSPMFYIKVSYSAASVLHLPLCHYRSIPLALGQWLLLPSAKKAAQKVCPDPSPPSLALSLPLSLSLSDHGIESV